MGFNSGIKGLIWILPVLIHIPPLQISFVLAMGVVIPPMPSVGSGKQGLVNPLLPTVM